MKRKSVTLLVSAAALVCLCGAYFALHSYNERAEERDAEEALGDTILQVDTSKVASASFSIGEQQYTFERDGEDWKLEGDDTFPADGTALENTLSELADVKALRILEDISDTAEFGMDEPQNVISLKLQDGSETVLTIGDTNEGTGDDYLMLADASSTVYTVASTVRTAFSDDLYDYAVSEELPDLTKDNITGIELSGAEHPYKLYKEDDTWRLDASAADSDAVDELLTELAGLYYVDYLEHNCSDLSPYGLDEPAAVLTVTVKADAASEDSTEADGANEDSTEADTASGDGTEVDAANEDSTEVDTANEDNTEADAANEDGAGESTLIIKIGGKDEAGNYYTQLADSTQVHTISSTVVDALLGCTPETLAESETEASTENETEASTESAVEAQTGSEKEVSTESEAGTPTGSGTEAQTGSEAEMPTGSGTGTPTESGTEALTENAAETPAENMTE